jgi:hydrogenase/urease accessory protein HupE
MDAVGLVNFLLNLAIIAVGYLGYQKKKNQIYLYMAIAFVVFAITNLLAALELATQYTSLVIVLRIIGYTTILYGLYKGMGKK